MLDNLYKLGTRFLLRQLHYSVENLIIMQQTSLLFRKYLCDLEYFVINYNSMHLNNSLFNEQLRIYLENFFIIDYRISELYNYREDIIIIREVLLLSAEFYLTCIMFV